MPINYNTMSTFANENKRAYSLCMVRSVSDALYFKFTCSRCTIHQMQ